MLSSIFQYEYIGTFMAVPMAFAPLYLSGLHVPPPATKQRKGGVGDKAHHLTKPRSTSPNVR